MWGGSMVSVKRYLWLIHLALIAAGVYIGSDLFWAIVGSRIEPGSSSYINSPSAAAATTEQRALQQYAVIQERNLFGAKNRTARSVAAHTLRPLHRLPNRWSI